MSERVTFTPGPWRIWKTGSEHWWICEPEQERRHSHFAKISVGNMWHEEGEANARLIVAAPESYDALRQYVSATDNEDLAELANAYESAKLAIAKIEGSD